MTSGNGPGWKSLLRALAEEIESLGDGAARDTLLRQTGRRMAAMFPVPHATRLDRLELDVNDLLGTLGWGRATFQLAESDHCLLIDHTGLPTIGGLGDPPGTWLSAVLEGLYEGWLSSLPGADPTLICRRARATAGTVLLRYAQGQAAAPGGETHAIR